MCPNIYIICRQKKWGGFFVFGYEWLKTAAVEEWLKGFFFFNQIYYSVLNESLSLMKCTVAA